MAVYDINGNQAVTLYDKDGVEVQKAYDVNAECVWDTGGGYYSHYMSHISAIDGLYSGFNYSNVYIIGNELVIAYLAKEFHFTPMADGTQIMRVARMNLTTRQVIESDVMTGVGYFGSVYYNGVYYIFDSFRKRYTTTDWRTFTESTYTLPSQMSEPYYITVWDNGRFVSTISYAVKGAMIYSDDLGVTWTRASGGTSANADHGGTAKVGDTLVAYCQDDTGANPTDDTPRRWVLTSTDNGETWDEALCTDPDLLKCGGSHASGAFCHIGEDWFYATGNRLQYTDDNGKVHLGQIQLFKGTAQDVLDGSMHLLNVLDDLSTGCTSIGIPNSTTWTDTGNLGMTTDGESLYCVYQRPLFHVLETYPYAISNSMVALSIIDTTSGQEEKTDDYYDPEWRSKMAAAVADHDTNHDFYIYADDASPVTNYSGSIYTRSQYNRMASGYVLPDDNLSIPFVSRFEMCFVGRFRETLNADRSGYIMAYLGANISGTESAITGTTNNLFFNKTYSTIGAGSLSTSFFADTYFRLKYENGILSATVNGNTIPNVLSKYYDSYNADINTLLFRCAELAAEVVQNSGSSGVIKTLWVDTDGDLTGVTV